MTQLGQQRHMIYTLYLPTPCKISFIIDAINIMTNQLNYVDNIDRLRKIVSLPLTLNRMRLTVPIGTFSCKVAKFVAVVTFTSLRLSFWAVTSNVTLSVADVADLLSG